MSLYMISICHMLEMIKGLSWRYADRMKEYPNILAVNFMKEVKITRRLKRKLLQDLYT